jgi:hypothetical protein
MDKVRKSADKATNSANKMGAAFALSVKRFAAFSIATRAVGLFTSTLSNAVDEAIAFEREMIKVSQVTGKTIKQLSDLSKEIDHLSVSFGVSSTALLSVSRILSQAGLSAVNTRVALEALAKSELAPTFENITQTAEGAVAVLAQFKQGAAALEGQLGAINAVAGKFAVEAGDLISVVRRTGGVFRAAGGDLNELIALFTSVRSTTRESAESIATGLRTIFTRIQRPRTVEYLKQFGVQLQDNNKQFVGAYESVRRLSEALQGLEKTDVRFIQIAEELGGFRQIGKVIPLLQEFRRAEEAHAVALKGSNSLTSDAAKAQEALAIRITQVQESFLKLVRDVTASDTFQIMARTSLALAENLLKVADAIRPLLPLIAALGAFKIAKSFASFGAGVASGLKSLPTNGSLSGGTASPQRLNSGGLVRGFGDSDGVPINAGGGEFVMARKSTRHFGVQTLQEMNDFPERFNKGGTIHPKRYSIGGPITNDQLTSRLGSSVPTPSQLTGDFGLSDNRAKTVLNSFNKSYGGGIASLRKSLISQAAANKKGSSALKTKKGSSDAALANKYPGGVYSINDGAIGGFFLEAKPAGRKEDFQMRAPKTFTATAAMGKGLAGAKALLKKGSVSKFFPKSNLKDDPDNAKLTSNVRNYAAQALESTISGAAKDFGGYIDIPPIDGQEKRIKDAARRMSADSNAVNTTTGFIFEGIIDALTGASIGGNQSNFDFPQASLRGNSRRLSTFFSGASFKKLVKADAKKSSDRAKDIPNKVVNDIKDGMTNGVTKRFAKGGPLDTIHALVAPNEFIIRKEAAEKIGYDKLSEMNERGKLPAFSTGGRVGPTQRFSKGGPNTGSSSTGGVFSNPGAGVLLALPALGEFANSMLASADAKDKETNALQRVVAELVSMGTMLASVQLSLAAFGVNLNIKNIKEMFGTGPNNISGMIGKLATKVTGGRAAPFYENATKGRRAVAVSQHLGNIRDRFRGGISNFDPTSSLINLTESSMRASKRFRGGVGSAYDRLRSGVLGAPNRLRSGVLGAPKYLKNEFTLDKLKGSFKGVRGAPGLLRGMLGRGIGGGFRGGLSKIASSGVVTGISGATAAAGGATTVSGLAAGAAAAAGPLLAFGTAVAVTSKLLTAMQDHVGKYNAAIKEGNVEKATEVAVLKEVPGIVSVFGETLSSVYLSLTGGPSTETLKKRAAAEALASKHTLEYAKNSKLAADQLNSVKLGNKTASEAFTPVNIHQRSKVTGSLRTSLAAFEATKAANVSAEGDKSTGVLAGVRNLVTLGGLLGETANQKNNRIDQEIADSTKASTEALQKDLDDLRPALNAVTQQVTLKELAGGGSATYEDFLANTNEETRASIEALGEEGELVRKQFENQKKAIQDNIKFIESLNFGFREVTGVAQNMSLQMSNLSSQSFNGFEKALAILEVSISEGAKSLDPAALAFAQKQLTDTLTTFGADDKVAKNATNALGGLNFVQSNIGDVLKEVQEDFAKSGGDTSANAIQTAISKKLTSKLDDAGFGDEVKNRLINSFTNFQFGQEEISKLVGGDINSLIDGTFGPLSEAMKNELLGPLKARAEQENILIGLTKDRIGIEQSLIASQKQALELQQEAAQIISDFGGAFLSQGSKTKFAVNRANLSSGRLGISDLASGSAAELRNRNRELFARSQAIRGAGDARLLANPGLNNADGLGAGGVRAANTYDELKKAQQDQIATIRELIKIDQESLTIAKAKNKLENDSLTSLISGDIESFLKKQGAVGATAALATGNQDLIGSFGPEALGAALNDLRRQSGEGVRSVYGQNLQGRGGLIEGASSAALQARGVFDVRSARALAGTTSEEERLRKSIRDKASTLTGAGELGVAQAQMDLDRAEIKINQANIILENKTDAVVKAAEDFAAGHQPGVAANGAIVPANAAVQNGAANGIGNIGAGAIPDAAEMDKTFSNFNSSLSANIDRLENLKFQIKIEDMNFNVNLTGANMLKEMTNGVGSVVLNDLQDRLRNSTIVNKGNGKVTLELGPPSTRN